MCHYGYFYTDLATGQCYYIPFTVMRGTGKHAYGSHDG